MNIEEEIAWVKQQQEEIYGGPINLAALLKIPIAKGINI